MLTLDDIHPKYHKPARHYVACVPGSQLHDLTCGHRIKSAPNASDTCGPNCLSPAPNTPIGSTWICRRCLADPWLDICGIPCPPDEYDGMENNADIVDIYTSDLRAQLGSGYRDSDSAEKKDNLLEFIANWGAQVVKVRDSEEEALSRMLGEMKVDVGGPMPKAKVVDLEKMIDRMRLEDAEAGEPSDSTSS